MVARIEIRSARKSTNTAGMGAQPRVFSGKICAGQEKSGCVISFFSKWPSIMEKYQTSPVNGRPERIPWARTLAWDPIDKAMWLVWYARTVHASKRWPGRLAMRNPLNAAEFNSENLLRIHLPHKSSLGEPFPFIYLEISKRNI